MVLNFSPNTRGSRHPPVDPLAGGYVIGEWCGCNWQPVNHHTSPKVQNTSHKSQKVQALDPSVCHQAEKVTDKSQMWKQPFFYCGHLPNHCWQFHRRQLYNGLCSRPCRHSPTGVRTRLNWPQTSSFWTVCFIPAFACLPRLPISHVSDWRGSHCCLTVLEPTAKGLFLNKKQVSAELQNICCSPLLPLGTASGGRLQHPLSGTEAAVQL